MAPETEVQAWLMQNIIPYITKIVKQFYQTFSNGISNKYLYVGEEGDGGGGGGVLTTIATTYHSYIYILVLPKMSNLSASLLVIRSKPLLTHETLRTMQEAGN